MALFEKWCDSARQQKKKKHLWTFVEKDGGRGKVWSVLCKTVLAHYHDLERIAQDVESLGYEAAAEIIRSRVPTGKRAMSGDLGEILAAELVEEELGFNVPVRRLHYKDGREVPLRGDDFIGVGYEGNKLCLLKGEAKSRKTLAKTTIVEAREALNQNHGRCTPASLLFVADRLMDRGGDDENLGRDIRNEVGTKSLPRSRIDHALFTLSGNKAPAALGTDLETADKGRNHTVIHVRIEDHQEFIAEVFKGAAKIGVD